MTTSRVETSDANNIPIRLSLPFPHHFVVFGMMAMSHLSLFASMQILFTLRLLETVVVSYWISDSKISNYSGNSLKEWRKCGRQGYVAFPKVSIVYLVWQGQTEKQFIWRGSNQIIRQPHFVSCVKQAVQNVPQSPTPHVNSRLWPSG